MRWSRQSLAALCLGALLGSAAVQAHTLKVRTEILDRMRLAELDARHWRQQSLQLRDQLAAINRKNERETYVQTVNLEVIKSPVPLIDVEAALEPYTELLLGMQLSAVKLSMVYHLLQQRRLVLGNHIYQVDVKALLLSPDVIILLRLMPQGRSHPS